MLKRTVHILFSFWLALLLLFGGTAKEFIHLFTSHQDTVHHACNDGELSFEDEHHHCSFLSFSLADFITHETHVPRAFTEVSYTVHNSPLSAAVFERVALSPSLRGPPAAC